LPTYPDELFGTPDGTKSHDQIAVLQDGRVIALGRSYISDATLFTGGTACELINVRVPDLRMIEYILNVQFDATPATVLTCGDHFQDLSKKITGNVVGMTLSGSEITGGTLLVEVIAIGPP